MLGVEVSLGWTSMPSMRSGKGGGGGRLEIPLVTKCYRKRAEVERFEEHFFTKLRQRIMHQKVTDFCYILIGKCILSLGKHYYVLEFFTHMSFFLLGFSR